MDGVTGTALQRWAGVDADEPVMLAVVFTDIVDSTTLARTVGDRAMFDMLVRHFDSARRHREVCHGYEIKLIGDAYMVAFRSASAALKFALLFRQDTGDSRIVIRAGIHVGQVRIKDNDIYGLMVNYASRLQHVLSNEGVFVSDFVKREVESERGSEQTDVEFLRVGAKLFRSFRADEVIWRIETPEIHEARLRRIDAELRARAKQGSIK